MSCDFMVILLLGLAYTLYSDEAQAYAPRQLNYGFGNLGFQPVYKQHRQKLTRSPLNHHRSYYWNPYQREDLLSYNPFYGGYKNFRRRNNDVQNTGVVFLKVPREKVLSMISSNELALLYQQNLAYDVPVDNPSQPRQIAISSALVESLMKIKSGVGKSLHGVAEVIGEVVNAGGGLLGTLGHTAKNIGNFFWVNQG